MAVTRQTLREYLAVTTRPQVWTLPLSLADLEAFSSSFAIPEEGPAVWDRLVRLARHTAFAGKQVRDANIVAAMLAHGETRLLTSDVSDLRPFEPLIELVA